MLGDSLIEGQDPEIIHGNGTTFWMNTVIGQVLITGCMQPPGLSLHPSAGLIAVDDRRVDDLLFDYLLDAFSGLVAGLIGGKQGALAERLPEQVS